MKEAVAGGYESVWGWDLLDTNAIKALAVSKTMVNLRLGAPDRVCGEGSPLPMHPPPAAKRATITGHH